MDSHKTYSKDTYYGILRNLKSQAKRNQYANLENKEFMIHMQTKGKYGEDATTEFTIEGITNAVAIFENYRAIGHSLNLLTLIVYLGDEKLKKVNFKYKNKK